jgi:hypothetical protein
VTAVVIGVRRIRKRLTAARVRHGAPVASELA